MKGILQIISVFAIMLAIGCNRESHLRDYSCKKFQ